MTTTRHTWSCIGYILVIGTGIGLVISGPYLFKVIKDKLIVLTPNSQAYHLWERFPYAVPMVFYFFNWTNPEDVYNETVKPAFEEVGPYRFLQDQIKSDIIWNDNGTVTFRQQKFWYYAREKTNGNLQDKVTTVNPVALATVHVSRTWNKFVKKGLSLTLARLAPTIDITQTVGQMLFEGYPDTLIKIAKTFPFFVGQELPPWDKFGWFYLRNGSTDFEGVYNMGTGVKSTLGRLYQWNYWSRTPYYNGDCAKVDGSAGEIFEPYSGKDSIRLFSSDLCRTLVLKYSGKSLVENIVGYKYTAEDYMFDNGTIYPQNECFCNGDCLRSGVVNVSSCRYGSPSFGSLPHFYNADPYYINSVDGIHPNKSKHEFFIILEPTTGLPLEVQVSLQINLMLQSYPGISMYEGANKVLIPMIWFQQKGKIPRHEAFMVRLILSIPVICTSLGIAIVALGIFLLFYIFYKRYNMADMAEKKNQSSRNEEDTPLKG